MVRLTKDKKGTPLFVEASKKVKKCYVDIVEAPPIVMPTADDLKFVDFVEEPTKSIFQTIDSLLENKETGETNPNLIYKVEELEEDISMSMLEDSSSEEEVVEVISKDDALNFKEDNEKLNYKIQSMMSFQVRACSEIADLKFANSKLRKRLSQAKTLKGIKSILEEK